MINIPKILLLSALFMSASSLTSPTYAMSPEEREEPVATPTPASVSPKPVTVTEKEWEGDPFDIEGYLNS